MNVHAHEAYTTRSLKISVGVELQCFHNLREYLLLDVVKYIYSSPSFKSV